MQYTTENLFQYNHCLRQLIYLCVVAFVDHLHFGVNLLLPYFISKTLVWLPLYSLAFEHLFDDVFDYYQMCFSGRQTFSSRNLVPLWKVLRVWFICWNLALLGVCYLILSSLCYLLEWDKSLSICVFISSFMLNSFCLVHLLNFVEQILCWFDSLI